MHDDVELGVTNRGTEFFEVLGDGDAGIGMLELIKILDKETIGSDYINGGGDVSESKEIFVSWITCIHMGVEYDFPE